MHFTLIDRVLERSEERLVALKLVSNAEEYLLDHFPTFPVLPGVMMIEALAQASRALLEEGSDEGEGDRWVLGGVRALKYGSFVKPGEALRVEVEVFKRSAEGVTLKCVGHRIAEGVEDGVAVSGRIEMRPVRVWAGLKTP